MVEITHRVRSAHIVVADRDAGGLDANETRLAVECGIGVVESEAVVEGLASLPYSVAMMPRVSGTTCVVSVTRIGRFTTSDSSRSTSMTCWCAAIL